MNPKSFKDAIFVALTLAVAYVIIAALCPAHTSYKTDRWLDQFLLPKGRPADTSIIFDISAALEDLHTRVQATELAIEALALLDNRLVLVFLDDGTSKTFGAQHGYTSSTSWIQTVPSLPPLRPIIQEGPTELDPITTEALPQ